LISVDANLKYVCFSANAEFFYQNLKPDSSSTTEPLCFYAQGGYFIMPNKLELAARYGYLDCDNGGAAGQCSGLDKINEVSATINYYFWRHSLKAQFGYDVINRDIVGDESGNDRNTNRWIFQVSSSF
jgi:hypothetical protein